MTQFPELTRPSVFIAAPSDVRGMRAVIRGIVRDLKSRAANDRDLDVYDWVIDTTDFDDWIPAQLQIPLPSHPLCAAVIGVFGERMGSLLSDDFPLAPIGSHAHPRADAPYRLVHPWPGDPAEAERVVESGGFPLTGSVFECLAALNESAAGPAGPHLPVLIVFIGEKSILSETDVEDAGFGFGSYRDHEAKTRGSKAFRDWCSHTYRPQLLQLRNFLRYLEHQNTYPQPLTEELAAARIRKFLKDHLGLSTRIGENPFKGLNTYEREDYTRYYGRSVEGKIAVSEIEALWVSGAPKFYGILAASGVGKSSFLRAGLIGHLCDPTRYRGQHVYYGLAVKPAELLSAGDGEGHNESTANPLHRLFSLCLDELSRVRNARLEALLENDARLPALEDFREDRQAHSAVTRLQAILEECRLVIGLDQFEEIVDELASRDLAPRWAPLVEFITAAARSTQLCVVYTLQHNRLDALSLDRTLGPLYATGRSQGLVFPEQNLREIICEPFRAEGAVLEPALVTELEEKVLSFAAGEASLLPLISLALHRIYAEVAAPALLASNRPAGPKAMPTAPRDALPPVAAQSASGIFAVASSRRNRAADINEGAAGTAGAAGVEPGEIVLRLKDCEGLLDVNRAVTDMADAALARAKDASGPDWSDTDTVSSLLDTLVRPGGIHERKYLLPTVPIPRLGAARRLAEELIRKRLLIHHRGRIQLVHEAVLQYWPPAKAWLESRRELMDLEAEVTFFANQWKSSGRNRDRLVAYEVDKAAELLARAWQTFTAAEGPAEVRLIREFGLALMTAHPAPARVIARTQQASRHVHVAAGYGDLALLRRFIEVDPDCVNAPSADGRTPLFWPAFDGNDATLNPLIDAGAAVEATDKDGWQPVHAAATGGKLGALRLLVGRGASAHAAGGPGKLTPLHLAAMGGHDETVSYLLDEAGADADATDDSDWTPLHHAVRSSHESTVGVLLRHRADPNKSLRSGWTPLHLAADEGRASIAGLLMRNGADVEKRLDTRTALHLAADKGHGDVIRVLLRDRHADSEARTHNDRRAIHLCAAKGYADAILALIQHGADREALDDQKQTAMHVAAAAGHHDAIRALKGADLTARDGRDRWPLRLALEEGHFEAARVLISELGAPLELPRDESWTLLHLAALGGHVRQVQFLLNAGADANVTGTDGSTPLHLAVEAGRDAVVRLLLAHNRTDVAASEVDGATPLHVAAECGQSGVLGALLERGSPPVDTIDSMGLTPLYLAAQAGHAEAMELLLKAGAAVEADASTEASSRPTPLQAAAEIGNDDAIEVLLRYGAELNAARGRKERPLHLAIRNTRYRTALRLLERGAPPALTPQEGPQGLAEILAMNRQLQLNSGGSANPDEIAVCRRLAALGTNLPAALLETQTEPGSVSREEAQLNSSRPPASPLEYDWIKVEDETRAWLVGEIGEIDGSLTVAFDTAIDWSSLPWYETTRLVRLRSDSWNAGALAIYYLLGADRGLYRLQGSSPPIHEVNASAPIRLNEQNVLAYLRFFCFFVRGEAGPFHVVESIDDPVLPQQLDPATRSVMESTIRPATYEGRDESGSFLCDASVLYSNALFLANFTVQPSGMISMEDDEPIATDLPFRIDVPLVFVKPAEV